MSTISSTKPMLSSVLTSSHDHNEDFVSQLRNQLTQIENNVQRALNNIQQRKAYTPLKPSINRVDLPIRHDFIHVLKEVAIKNNLPFDELHIRQQILDKQDSAPASKAEINPVKSLPMNDTNNQHLSPINNNNRRSQFAPVLSSTPVHQTSPVTPIPINLTLATPSVVPALTLTSTNLPTVLPSAIAPQRAKTGRAAGRPPRIPRAEIAIDEKKNSPIAKEQENEIVLTKEIRVSSKRSVKGKRAIVEDHVEVVIEQKNDPITDMIKQVQTTPLRGRAKKMTAPQSANIIPPVEQQAPSVESIQDQEIVPKNSRAGRMKKKEQPDEKVPTIRMTSRSRNRKEPMQESLPSTRTTRTKKPIDPIAHIEEDPPISKVRATPARSRVKPTLDVPEPVTLSPPKKATGRSKKRKIDEDTNDNAIDTIKPPSPKRRMGRNVKTKDAPSIEPLPITPVVEHHTNSVTSTRTSRRGKKDVDSTSATSTDNQPDAKLPVGQRGRRGKKQTDMPTISPAETEVQPETLPVRSSRRGKKHNDASVITPAIIELEVNDASSTRTSRRGKKDLNASMAIPVPIEVESSRASVQGRRRGKKDVDLSIAMPTVVVPQQEPTSTRTSVRGKKGAGMTIKKQEEIVLNKRTRAIRSKQIENRNADTPVTVVDVVMTSVTISAPTTSSTKSLISKPPRPPVARKKQSIAMVPVLQTSPMSPITTHRIEATSPINAKPLLPLPIPAKTSRTRQLQVRIPDSPIRTENNALESLPSTTNNLKRPALPPVTTPKRMRREDLLIMSVPSTPGKKRKKCTCQKRRNKICDICASAIDI